MVSVTALGCGSDAPDETTLPRPEVTELLAHYDSQFAPAASMLQESFNSPGYHSAIEPGAPVHPTRESLIYALALLQRNDEGDAQRAADIITAVLSLQDSDPSSPTCGVWPWLLEEPIDQMESPDMNWADFCAASIVHMLKRHAEQLPSDVASDMRESLRLATNAIRRRNVGPGYSNIAILGGGACAAAGEVLDDDDLLAYGRTRLQAVVAHVEKHDGFTEYNSPPYARVVLAECDRALQLLDDDASRAAAETLHRSAWKMIAESFHPATQQWAGPHSRTSRVRLRRETVEFLGRRVGLPLETHPSKLDGKPRGYAVVRPVACPDGLIPAFTRQIDEPYEIQRTFINARDRKNRRVGITWLSSTACLGSVNRASFWTQRKPLIGYWKTGTDPAVCFRVRFLHNGQDFASMGMQTVQNGPRTLSALYSIPGRGDWHPSLDRPQDGTFHAASLCWRFELSGVGVSGTEIDSTQQQSRRFELAVGDHRIVVHAPTGCEFARTPVHWELQTLPDVVCVDCVCYDGEARPFDFSDPIDMSVAAGVELLGRHESAAELPPSVSRRAADWKLPSSPVMRIALPKQSAVQP